MTFRKSHSFAESTTTAPRAASSAGSRARRHAVAAALILLTLALVASWATPRISARAAAWLQSVPVHAKTVRAVAELMVQSDGAQRVAARLDAGRPAASAIARIDAGFTFDMVGVQLRLPPGVSPASLRVAVRTSRDGKRWSDWWPLPLDIAGPRVGGKDRLSAIADPAWVGAARFLQYQVSKRAAGGAAGGTVAGSARSLDVRFSFLNVEGDATLPDRLLGGLKSTVAAIAGQPRVATAAAMTDTPTIVTRAQWGANESWRSGSPDYATVKMAFVHHTAGSNNYSRAQSAAIVRGIYYFHTHTRGWRDIGYNFLIDRYGTIFEGRYGGITKGPIGAQVYGFNTGSTGVAMIGSFNSVEPPQAAITSLEKLLAWKLDVHHINPLGTAVMTAGATEKFAEGQKVTLPVIAGHRQVNYTDCPGDALFSMLPDIRQAVAGIGLPKIYDFAVSATVISPNGDGQQDSLTVTSTNSEADDWSVAIRNSAGVLVRTLSGHGVTASATWNGCDKSGVVMPDGAYTLTASATSALGTALPATATVFIDTTPPKLVSGSLRAALFSPNGDGIADLALVDFVTSEALSARLQVKDANGATVRVYKWASLAAGKHTLSWDGASVSNGTSAPAPDGAYTIQLDLRDSVGNSVSTSFAVQLNRIIGSAVMSPSWFSPNGDGRADTVALSFQIFSPATVKVKVAGKAGVVLRFSPELLAAGAKTWSWDGRDQTGALVPDGRYRASATASNATGSVSVGANITKDTTRPRLSAPTPRSLVLGGKARLTCTVKDTYSTLALITATVTRPSGARVKSFHLGWVRVGQKHVCVFKPASAGRYYVTFSAQDQALNSAVPVVISLIVK